MYLGFDFFFFMPLNFNLHDGFMRKLFYFRSLISENRTEKKAGIFSFLFFFSGIYVSIASIKSTIKSCLELPVSLRHDIKYVNVKLDEFDTYMYVKLLFRPSAISITFQNLSLALCNWSSQ